MSTPSFSCCRSSFFGWFGGRCDVTFTFDSFNTDIAQRTFLDRSCEFDMTVFNTVCECDVRGPDPVSWFHLPALHAYCIDPIPDLAGFPFVLSTAYAAVCRLLHRIVGLPPGYRYPVYRFICGEVADAARTANGLRHNTLAIRVTAKVASFVASDSTVPDKEELVFWEEEEAGPGEGACAVCLEEMEEGKTVARLRCGHAFDKSCISRWLERKMQCPLCRSSVEEIF